MVGGGGQLAVNGRGSDVSVTDADDELGEGRTEPFYVDRREYKVFVFDCQEVLRTPLFIH